MSSVSRPRITYISWAPHCSRSDHTARELGGSSHMIYWERLGSRPATVWLKYLGQALRTWHVLARERADAVFVMSPSPIAVLAVYSYCAVTRTPFVIDAHSGAFRNPMWKRLQGMQFWLCRRARATIVTNDHLATLVATHGGHPVIVPDVPVRFETAQAQAPAASGANEVAPHNRFTVACVTSFGFDEPIAAIFESARRLPDVNFYMTGNPKDAPDLVASRPSNVTLTGFLATPQYGALLQRADVVLALTTLDHTMLRGAYEAIYQGTPVIVSDSGILRSAFDEGAVHVNNSAEAIVEAIEQVRQRPQAFREAALRLRARKEQRWLESMAALRAAIDTPRTAKPRLESV
jgi:glycosyltransferase involved in cell wall biosynthesis